MTRNQIIQELKNYFSVKELVCKHTYKKWGEQSWQFLDSQYLYCLLIIRRDILQAPMTCNSSGSTQRGLRCNLCDIVQGKTDFGNNYLSAHVLGKAGDFTVMGMTAEEARQKITANARLLPCPIRIEGGVSWLHFDTIPQWNVEDTVFEFYKK